MVQLVVIGLPALIALLVCIFRGARPAFLTVYLPTLLLLPQYYQWPIVGHLGFGEAAILPVAIGLLLGAHSRWRWSSIDFLVAAFIALTVIAEYQNRGYYEGQNLAIHQICSLALPYIACKIVLRNRKFDVAFAKSVTLMLTVVAIVSLFEFRMGSNLFEHLTMRFFPGSLPAPVNYRAGFKRIVGPYGHAILMGVMMAAGFRIVRWLEWEGSWSARMPIIHMTRVRFCRYAIIAGSLMTISLGPWLGLGAGSLMVWVCRAANRRRALVMILLAGLLVFMPLYSGVKSYVATSDEYSSTVQEDAAYRNRLIPLYLPIVEERPTWGWGRNLFPRVPGMASVDNEYLLTALTYGVYTLAAFAALLLWIPLRLLGFALRLRRDDPAALLGFTLAGLAVGIIVAIATVWTGGQTATLVFLTAGWAEGLMAARTMVATSRATVAAPDRRFRFERVMV